MGFSQLHAVDEDASCAGRLVKGRNIVGQAVDDFGAHGSEVVSDTFDRSGAAARYHVDTLSFQVGQSNGGRASQTVAQGYGHTGGELKSEKSS